VSGCGSVASGSTAEAAGGTVANPTGSIKGQTLTGLVDAYTGNWRGLNGTSSATTTQVGTAKAQWQHAVLLSDHTGACGREGSGGGYAGNEVGRPATPRPPAGPSPSPRWMRPRTPARMTCTSAPTTSPGRSSHPGAERWPAPAGRQLAARPRSARTCCRLRRPLPQGDRPSAGRCARCAPGRRLGRVRQVSYGA
jgi:hypothetical protein